MNTWLWKLRKKNPFLCVGGFRYFKQSEGNNCGTLSLPVIKSILVYASLPIPRCCKASFTLSLSVSLRFLLPQQPFIIQGKFIPQIQSLHANRTSISNGIGNVEFHCASFSIFDLRVFGSNSSDPSVFRFQILSPSVEILFIFCCNCVHCDPFLLPRKMIMIILCESICMLM